MAFKGVLIAVIVVAIAVGIGAAVLLQQQGPSPMQTHITTSPTTTTTKMETKTSETTTKTTPTASTTPTFSTTKTETTVKTTTTQPVTTGTPTASTTTTMPTTTTVITQAPSGELVVYKTLTELFSNIKHMKYELNVEESNGTKSSMTGGFTIIGEDTINGINVWLVKIEYVAVPPEGEEQSAIIEAAISKEDALVLKLTITQDGVTQEIPKEQLSYVGMMVLQPLFMPFLMFVGSSADLEMQITETGVAVNAQGVVVNSKPITVTVGGNAYKAYEISFTATKPVRGVISKGTYVVAELYENHWFIVSLDVYTEQGDHATIRVIELTPAY